MVPDHTISDHNKKLHSEWNSSFWQTITSHWNSRPAIGPLHNLVTCHIVNWFHNIHGYLFLIEYLFRSNLRFLEKKFSFFIFLSVCNWIGLAGPVYVSDWSMAACCLCGQRFILSSTRQDMLCKSIEFPLQCASNYTLDEKSGRSVTITSSGALPPFPRTYFRLDAYWCRWQFMLFSLVFVSCMYTSTSSFPFLWFVSFIFITIHIRFKSDSSNRSDFVS